jgi:hypothetical protein
MRMGQPILSDPDHCRHQLVVVRAWGGVAVQQCKYHALGTSNDQALTQPTQISTQTMQTLHIDIEAIITWRI